MHLAHHLQSLNKLSTTLKSLLFAALCIYAATGVSQLQNNDDIRLLQHLPKDLKGIEAQITEITAAPNHLRHILVEANTIEELLQREEALLDTLSSTPSVAETTTAIATSQRIPSDKRLNENRLLIEEALNTSSPTKDIYLQTLGEYENTFNGLITQTQRTAQYPLTVHHWLSLPESEAFRYLWLDKTEYGYASLVAYSAHTKARVENKPANLQSANSSGTDGFIGKLIEEHEHLTHIDPAAHISFTLKEYRERASYMLALAAIIVLILLRFRFGWRGAILVLLPPVSAAFFALGTLGWFGFTINLFHLLALILTLGIGIDYSLFLSEVREKSVAATLAILLSAITTLTAFGLLALSKTAAISGFGTVVSLAITASLILTPLLITPRPQQTTPTANKTS